MPIQLSFDKKTLKYLQAICKREQKLANYSIFSIQKNSPQLNLFHGLADQLDQQHPLYQLANKINWSVFDNDFKKHYSEKQGAAAMNFKRVMNLWRTEAINRWLLIFKYVENAYGSFIAQILNMTFCETT